MTGVAHPPERRLSGGPLLGPLPEFVGALMLLTACGSTPRRALQAVCPHSRRSLRELLLAQGADERLLAWSAVGDAGGRLDLALAAARQTGHEEARARQRLREARAYPLLGFPLAFLLGGHPFLALAAGVAAARRSLPFPERELLTMQFLRALGLLLDEGVPLLQALPLAGEVTTSPLGREVARESLDGLLHARRFRINLCPTVTSFIRCAEETGEPGRVMAVVAEQARVDLRDATEDLVRRARLATVAGVMLLFALWMAWGTHVLGLAAECGAGRHWLWTNSASVKDSGEGPGFAGPEPAGPEAEFGLAKRPAPTATPPAVVEKPSAVVVPRKAHPPAARPARRKVAARKGKR